MSEVDRILEANRTYAASFGGGDLEIPPARSVLVLTCIDARLDPAKILGLEIGDAHVLRNAGGRVTDDVVRSALISSWLLGTRAFLVIHHTDCGLTKFTDDVLHGMIRDATGIDVSDDDYLAFSDVDQSVRDDVARLGGMKTHPEDVTVAGHVYDVRLGELREVEPGGVIGRGSGGFRRRRLPSVEPRLPCFSVVLKQSADATTSDRNGSRSTLWIWTT